MTHVVVDPYLVTVPTETAVDSAASWLVSLAGWLQEVESAPCEWWHFGQCVLELMVADRYPRFDLLAEIVDTYDIPISVPLVVRRLNWFFQDEARDLRHVAGVTDALLAGSAVEPEVTPPEFMLRNELVRSSLAQGLTALACGKVSLRLPEAEVGIVTADLPGGVREVRVAGTVELTEPERAAAGLSGGGFAHTFPALVAPERLADIVDIGHVAAESAASFRWAVERSAARMAFGRAIRAVRIGRSFWDSLVVGGILSDPASIRKLVKLAAATAVDKLSERAGSLRPLRTSRAGNAPQSRRASDSAAAWRATVARSGVGWRLHFWHVSAGDGSETIEFANVLKKGDPPDIPE